ncbi:MAG TPA: tRNA (adenosine(37)-N6)-threonylcarbamoyltransferase complex ATPase subunit type 1 TsaE [Flavipsychrobacter sp.]|nr:tRNA (adenosine(37)-N6)-threonylcarbamoyltransferase complex ATPase subunit type 1 TsaE [Flavipsychrobacter sp.]
MQAPLLKTSFSLSDIKVAASWILKYIPEYRIAAFSGEMGSGKTTLIHEICKQLGVKDSVNSPTFALINEYNFHHGTGENKTIYHMDWYRLKNIEEAINTGMEDCLQQKDAYCFVEWPEQAWDLLSFPYLLIDLHTINASVREMKVFVRE